MKNVKYQMSNNPLLVRLTDMKSVVLAFSITVIALACSHPPPGRGAGEVETSQLTQTSFKVETVIPNLEVVWSIVWAPDGRMLFTERPGRVQIGRAHV